MARLIRLAGLAILVLVALVVASASILWIGLRTDYGQQLLRRQLVSVLQSSIAADIQLGQVGGVPGRSFEIRNLRVAVGGRTVVRLPRISVEYAPLELLRGRILLRSVTFEKPWVRVVHASGRWVIPKLVEGKGRAPAIPVHVGHLRIRGGRLGASWREGGAHRRIAATDLNLESSAVIEVKLQELRIAELSFVPRGMAVSPVRASGTVARYKNGSICLVDAQLATDRSRLAVSGCINRARAVSVRLALDPLDAGEARAVFTRSRVRTDVVATVAARGPWHDTRVALSADLDDGGTLKGRGILDMESEPPRYRGSVAFSQVDPRVVFSRGMPVSLNGRGRFRGAGLGGDAAVRWRVTFERCEIAGRFVDGFRMAGKSARGEHSFTGRIETGAARVGLRGRVSQAAILTYGLAARIRFGESDGFLEKGGRGFLSLVGRGTEPGDREAELWGTLTGAALPGVIIDRARLHAKLDGDQLSLQNLSVEGPGVAGNVRGSVYLPTRTIDLALHATAALRRLGAALDQPLAGALDAAATVRGPLEALAVTASVSGTDLGWQTTTARQATMTLDAMGVGGREPAASARVNIEELRVTGGRPRTVSGNLSWVRTAQGDEVTVGAVARVGGRVTERMELQMARTERETRGKIRKLSLTPLGDARWRLAAPASFVVRGGLATDPITLEAGRQMLTLGGRLSLKGENDAVLSLRRVDLAPICAALSLPECRGRLSVEATVRGTAAAPVARATGSAAGLGVGSVGYGRLDFEALYRGHVMSVDAELSTPVAGRLDLEAAVPVDLAWAGSRRDVGRDPLEARIHADALDLAFLPVILPREVRTARGRVGVDIRVAGTRDAPDAEGSIRIDGGSLELTRFGCRYDDVGARIDVTGSHVSVAEIHATSGDGTLEGSGWIEVDGEAGPRFSLSFVMDEFLAVRTRRYEATTSGEVRLAGSPKAPEVTGSLAVTRATLRLPRIIPFADPRAQPDPTIEVVGVTERQAPAEASPTGLDGPLRIDLDLRADGNAWVRREDMNVEIGGELRVERDPYRAPSVHGRLTLRRGWYGFQGRRFNVREGTLTFRGKAREPHVDVIGSYRAGEYTVVAHVTGSGSKPSLDLSSEPALDQADILAVLLFGKPSGKLTGRQATSLQEQTMSLAGGYAIGELSGSVRDALGLDTLEVRLPGGARGEGSVTVGRYVTKDVFVSFAQEFGESISEVVRVEYGLTPRISIRGSTSSLGNSTIDFLVSHRY